ncbi:MAG: hypothetical protein QM490_02475 [Candidatus Gracilibacteria bacterium]
MKFGTNRKATSIIEAMIVMLIIVTGVTGMYNMFSKSVDLSNTTMNKIQAIQMATQGIEGVTNIRDTNWLLFSSDYKNCWNTLNYDASCIGNDNDDNYKILQDNLGYKIYRDSFNRWLLTSTGSSSDYTSSSYRNFFRVGLKDGVYAQTGTVDNFRPLFTREIIFNYLEADGTTIGDEFSPKMKITAIIQWVDNTSTVPHKIEINQLLSNWKK